MEPVDASNREARSMYLGGSSVTMQPTGLWSFRENPQKIFGPSVFLKFVHQTVVLLVKLLPAC